MPHIKYSDSQVRKSLVDYFQFLRERFSKFGQFLPTEEYLNTFDTDELSELYSNIMEKNALTSDDIPEQNKDRIKSFMNSNLIPENKKEAFKNEINNSTVEECNLFLRGMTFGEAPHIEERKEMQLHAETKKNAEKCFKDSLNMLNARKERTNFFGRKVKNSDEFTAVMDALEKLNNAPYDDNNEEIANAKKACEAYISTHKHPLSTIGRDRLNIINTLNERLKLSMEEVNEFEKAKKTWTRDDVSVDPQRVDKYAKMIMLTNDVRLENIMDTSKDQTYANACLQASNLLKDAYLKNDTKELDALKEKCAFALSKSIDSFEGKVILDKGETIDFENKGKAFFNGMISSLKEEDYSNSNKLQELSAKVTTINANTWNNDYGEFLRVEGEATLNRLESIFSNDENLKNKAQNFLFSSENSLTSVQFRLSCDPDPKYTEEEQKADVGRMIAYSILRHEIYSPNPNKDVIGNILSNPDGTLEVLAGTDFGQTYVGNTKKLQELANMETTEIYKSAREQSGSIRSGYFTAISGGNQEAHEAKVEADKKAENERKRAEQEILDYKKLKEEQEKAEYDLKNAESAHKWSKNTLGEDNKITKTMSEHVKNRKKELDMIYEKNKDKIKPSSDFEKGGF